MASVLALAAAVVCRFCRKPALAHALWLLVLLKLIVPPLWKVPVSDSLSRLIPQSTVPALEHVAVPVPVENASPARRGHSSMTRAVAALPPLVAKPFDSASNPGPMPTHPLADA